MRHAAAEAVLNLVADIADDAQARCTLAPLFGMKAAREEGAVRWRLRRPSQATKPACRQWGQLSFSENRFDAAMAAAS
jgi:hypothetical protein